MSANQERMRLKRDGKARGFFPGILAVLAQLKPLLSQPLQTSLCHPQFYVLTKSPTVRVDLNELAGGKLFSPTSKASIGSTLSSSAQRGAKRIELKNDFFPRRISHSKNSACSDYVFVAAFDSLYATRGTNKWLPRPSSAE